MQQSLFDDFSRPTKSDDSAIAKKANSRTRKAPTTVKGGGLLDKVKHIRSLVESALGKYKYQSITINDIGTLNEYVDKCIANGALAVDTETTGLNPLLDKIVGVCLYTPNEKYAYIPIRHRSILTGELLPNQLDPDDVAEALRPLEAIKEDIMFNAQFDMRFLKNDLGLNFDCTWDTSLAAKIMNENEESNALKPLHQKYVLKDSESEFKFEQFFKGIPFDLIPIDIATLYGAHDAVITWELKEFQAKYLYYDETEDFSARNGMNGASWTFFNIEMPCVKVVCDMEDNGVLLDTEYAKELSVKYNKLKDDALAEFYSELEPFADKIESYRFKAVRGEKAKLDNPINIDSPLQLAVLFYDILGYESVDKKSPRGTGEAILAKFDTPLAKSILKYRTIDKLLGTYIDKLPNCINPNDGRVHCEFKQYGAKTGRFSSSDPNLQNIPSHNKDIRKMFTASEGCLLMSSDFSQQEPKCLAALCKRDGDPQMYNTFMEGKDLYSEIASKSFHKSYEECREFDDNGNKNPPEYKERRTQAKSILLGALYGRGVPSIAEQLGCSVDKAQDIKDSVFKGFPAIKKFEEDSLSFAREYGYVTTVCGRKRRLPDLMLDEFEFKWKDGPKSVDVLDFDDVGDNEVPEDIQRKYLRKLARVEPWNKRKIFEEANEKDGVWIVDNGLKIADATRQCVNSRIQGSAADLTKLAMIDLYNNKRLKELGFKLLIQVHDEVIAECPKENIKECSELLAQVMSQAAEKVLEMPIKCDVEITDRWYGTPFELSDIYYDDGTLKPEEEWVTSGVRVDKESQTSHAMDAELRQQ